MTSTEPSPEVRAIELCPSAALINGGSAVSFDVVYGGHACRAFAIRYDGQVHAYLNRCTHVAMEMDYRENHFFDDSKKWLLCATHGAVYRPDTGECSGGPCRGGLVKIGVSEHDGVVRWHTDRNLQSVQF